jgi:hypothetical protein
MTMTVQGDGPTVDASGNTIPDTWTFEEATLTWSASGAFSSANTSQNVLTGLLKVQTFDVPTTATLVNFIYEIPEAILELDTAEMSLVIKMKTSSNVIVGPLKSLHQVVDIKTPREQYWKRNTSGQGSVDSSSPSSYLTYDFFGAGLYGNLGEDINMGNVEIQIDGVVTQASIDMYPQDIPEGSNPQNPTGVRYVKKRFYATQDSNGQHRLKLTLLDEKNPRSINTSVSLTNFTIEEYLTNSRQIIERDVLTSGHSDMILHSYPTPFDANLLAGQLSLSANLLELATQLDAELSGSNVFFTSSNTTGNTTSANTVGVVTAGNTAAVAGNVAKPRSKSLGLTASDALLVEMFDGDDSTSVLYSGTSGKKLNFTKGDKIHRLNLTVVSALGRSRKSGDLFYVPMVQPKTWLAGNDSLTLTSNGQTYTLSRSDTSATWEAAIITIAQDDLSIARRSKALIVQKVGEFGVLDFSVSGPDGNYQSIQGVTSQGSTVQLSKTNIVTLPETLSTVATTLDTASSISNNASSVSGSSGGGGGGCLLAQ